MTFFAPGPIFASVVLGAWIGLGVASGLVHWVLFTLWLVVTVWMFRDEINLQYRKHRARFQREGNP